MTNTFETFRTEFFRLAEKAESIAITAHLSPDDDSIGSVLVLRYILKKLYPGKTIRAVYEGVRPDKYEQISGFGEIEFMDDMSDGLNQTDMLIVLDVNKMDRVSGMPEKLKGVAVTVCIDHHSSPPDAFTLSCIEPAFSSNSELIYRIFEQECQPLSVPLAEPLLLGVIGDTGNFSYIRPDQTDVFPLVKELIETLGISIDEFRSRYGGIPAEIIPLLKVLMANMTYETIDGWPPFQYSYIDRETINAGGFTDEEVSSAGHIFIRQYIRSVRGYGWGFVVTPRLDGTCRVSLRSLPKSVNVRNMMERMGLGGGHDRASGGLFKKEGDAPRGAVECAMLILDWIRDNKSAIM